MPMIDGEEVRFSPWASMAGEFVEHRPEYTFDGFTLRMTRAADRERAQAWADADPEHAWEAAQPGYWTECLPGVECWVLEDAVGTVFFLRMLRVATAIQVSQNSFAHPGGRVEISIQFAPGERGAKLRTLQGLSRGMQWLEKRLRERGVDAVYFNSKNLRLIHLACARLGFGEVENEYEPSRRLGFRRFRKALTA